MILPQRLPRFLVLLLLAGAALWCARPLQAQTRSNFRHLDSLLNEGLYRSAAGEAARLYRQSEPGGRPEDAFRALLGWFKASAHLGSDPLLSGLRLSDSLRERSGGVLQAWLWAARAGFLERILNRYRFELPGSDAPHDPSPGSWSAFQLQDSITRAYRQALKPASALLGAPSRRFRMLLDSGELRFEVRPNLYDVVAARALEFWAGAPSRPFPALPPAPLDWKACYGPADVFEHLDLGPGSDPPRLSLRLYQRLLRLHRKDPSPDAYAALDLRRLSYVYSHSGEPMEDTAYLRALNRLRARLDGTPAQADLLYALAVLYQGWGERYQPFGDTAGRWDLRRALELCRQAFSRYPGSVGGRRCRTLERRLDSRSLQLQAEQVSLPGVPSRVLLRYRNLSGVRLRLQRLNGRLWEQELLGVQLRADLPGLRTLKRWSLQLPDPRDLQDHSVEVPLPALAPGRYLLSVAPPNGTEGPADSSSWVAFSVSDLALLQGASDRLLLLSRSGGRPVGLTEVKFFQAPAAGTPSSDSLRPLGRRFTDAQGRLDLDSLIPEGPLYLRVQRGEDRLWMRMYRSRRPPAVSGPRKRLLLYTDRSLYRPGALLQVAGLRFAASDTAGDYRTDPGRRSTLYLIRPDGVPADSARFVSAADGSFQGSFPLAADALTGTWRIWSRRPYAECSIQVESYRRPSAELQLRAAPGSWVLGDSVRMEGSTAMLSGFPLSGTLLHYRIYLHRIGPLMRGPNMRQSGDRLLWEDTLHTDSKGRFGFRFLARSDQPQSGPESFRVLVELEAPDGSTLQQSAELMLSRLPFSLKLSLPRQEPLDSFRFLSLGLQGNVPHAALDLQLSWVSLRSQGRWVRPRFWPRPDEQLLSRQAFHRLFPLDPYGAEDDPFQWPSRGGVHTLKLRWHPGSPIAVPAGWRQQGWYRLRLLARDDRGRRWSDSSVVNLYRFGAAAGPNSLPALDARLLSPGRGAARHDQLLIRAAVTGALWICSRQGTADVRCQWMDDTSGYLRLDLGAVRADEGGRSVRVLRFFHNRLYQQQLFMPRPRKDRQLVIRVLRRPGNLAPGDTARWELELSSPQGRPLKGTVTADLYDAALDGLRPHVWTDPDLYPPPAPLVAWNDPEGLAAYGALWNSAALVGSPWLPAVPRLSEEYLPTLPFRIFAFSTAEAQAPLVPGPLSAAAPDQEPLQNYRRKGPPTAFFRASLESDRRGRVRFQVPMPGELTRWRLLVFAHDARMAYGFYRDSLQTRKPLMLVANLPQALLAGDSVQAGAVLFNATDSAAGVQLEACAGPDGRDSLLGCFSTFVRVAARGSATVFFPLKLPMGAAGALRYRIRASSGSHSDAVEGTLPVLASRIPLYASRLLETRGNGSWRVDPPSLGTLRARSWVLQWSSNPAWEALSALPQLLEEPYPDALSWAGKLYSACLGESVLENHPELRSLWIRYRRLDSLQGATPLNRPGASGQGGLSGTPWLADAASDAALRAALGRLFESDTLQHWQVRSWTALRRLQQKDGGMAWLDGGPSDQTSSARVLIALQQALALRGLTSGLRDSLRSLIRPLVRYLDERLHRQLASQAVPVEVGPLLGSLYAASAAWLWVPADSLSAERPLLLGLLERNWRSFSFADQAACALVMQRLGASAAARQVLASLRQTALPDGGMHWRQPDAGWSEEPVFDQSLMLEAFLNLGGTASEERSMQDWLIGQKQGLRWQGSTGTLAAVAALVERQSDWFSRVPELRLRLGDTSVLLPGQGQVDPLRRWQLPESLWAGRGADTPVLEVSGAAPGAPGWISLFAQYQAPLQGLAAGGNGLEIRRRLELDTGTPLGPEADLAPGTPLQVVLDIRSSRDLDYVVLSDQPGSLLGLPYQTSGWSASGGIGYYRARQGTRSLFYIRHLPRGSYQIRYPAYIERSGTGLSGVSELRCLYAPALQAHSAGARLRVP